LLIIHLRENPQMPEARTFYIAVHNHAGGGDAFLISSSSDRLDGIDMAVAEPDVFELQLDDEGLDVDPVPLPLKAILDQADPGLLEDLADMCPKYEPALPADRAAYYNAQSPRGRERIEENYPELAQAAAKAA